MNPFQTLRRPLAALFTASALISAIPTAHAAPVVYVDVRVGADEQVSFSPDPVAVKKPHTLIVFRLKTAGWAFADEGAIEVSEPGTQFPAASWTEQADRASLLDLMSESGQFKYSVTLVHKKTGRRLVIDPVIKNGADD
ncbi:hypothetical protein [Ideonella sp. YS5]|uniref:hypothetical protein n=1 Tax=Ideonella sp. YS5 TaxID=3453714 RepID=UPI003EE9268D